jgi:hypothetical protein
LLQILFIIFCAYECNGVKYGTGRHSADISTEDYPKAMQVGASFDDFHVTGLTRITDVVDL